MDEDDVEDISRDLCMHAGRHLDYLITLGQLEVGWPSRWNDRRPVDDVETGAGQVAIMYY